MGKTENSKTYHISQLIETAIEQLKYSFTPSLTALKNAVLSAQFVGVYAAFSILHPV